jgi:hypothetical protein
MEIINQLANIKMSLLKKNWFFSKEYGIIVNYFNVLFWFSYFEWLDNPIFLHDEAKKELKGKKTENGIFIIKSKFNKVKLHQYDKNNARVGH